MKKTFFKMLLFVFLFITFCPVVTAEETHTVSIVVNQDDDGTLAVVPNTTVMVSQDGTTIGYATSNENGVANFTLSNGTYTIIAGTTSGRKSYYGKITLTVSGEDVTKSVVMSRQLTPAYATEIYNATSYFNHIDIRVNGTFTTNENGNLVTHWIKLTNVTLSATNNGTDLFTPVKFTSEESYEWRKMNVQIPKSAIISLTFDINLNGKVVREGFTYTFSGQSDFEQAIINCDQNQGLDFIMNPEEILKRAFYEVKYDWQIQNEDGSYEDLPSSLATPPVDSNSYLENDTHTLNTIWEKGDKIVDGNIIYTFEGWEHYIMGNEDKVEIFDTLTEITITDDTIIHGVWKKTELTLQVSNYLVINKKFIGNDGHMPKSLYFKVIDANDSSIDPYVIEIPLLAFTYNASEGYYTYKLPIYSTQVGNEVVNSTYKIEEHETEILGYTYNASASSESVQSVSTDFTSEVCATFENVYIKNEGNNFYNSGFIIQKTDYHYNYSLKGAIFTLTNNATGMVLTSTPTDESGYALFYNLEEGIYTLKETVAPSGYLLDSKEYTVTVTLVNTTEVYSQTQNAYVTKYDYDVDISPDVHYNSNAFGSETNRLTIFNKMLGTITITKEFALASDINKDNYNKDIEIIVTGENYSKVVSLNKDNNWKVTLTDVVIGTYSIKENIETSKVDGYTLDVNYGNNADVYELTLDADNNSQNVVITNTYKKIITYIDVDVQKVWEGTDEFPETTEVGLYKDGVLEETVILSKDNEWKYSWNVNSDFKWTVDEITEFDDYIKTVTKENNSYIITNTYESKGTVIPDDNNVPNTKDNSYLKGYFILTTLSFMGLIFTSKKRNI